MRTRISGGRGRATNRVALKLHRWALVTTAMTATTCAATACATTSHSLIGLPRAPVAAADVRVFLAPVSDACEKIAFIEASSRLSFAWTAEAKAEVVMRRLKGEAAKLGANAIVLQELTDGAIGTVDAGVATGLGEHGSIGVGFNGAGLLANRFGRAVAVDFEPACGSRYPPKGA